MCIPSPESCLARDCLLLAPAYFPDDLEAGEGTSASSGGGLGSTGKAAKNGVDCEGVDVEMEGTAGGDAPAGSEVARAWSPADFLV